MKHYKINEYGRSMIEMLGVLAIVGVLSVAGISGYSKGMTKYKTNQLLDQASTIVANVRTTFANEGRYTYLNMKSAYKLKIFPEDMTKTCNPNSYFNWECVKNAFNGTNRLSGWSGSTFELYMSGIPSEACFSLIMADWNGFLTRASVMKIVGNGSQGGASINADSLSDLATVTNACGASDTVMVGLFFK